MRLLDDRLRVEMIVAATFDVLGVRALEVLDAVLADLEDPGRDLAHEPSIVADERDRPVVLPEPLGETASFAKINRAASPPDNAPRRFSTSSFWNSTRARWERTKPIGSPGQKSHSHAWRFWRSPVSISR